MSFTNAYARAAISPGIESLVFVPLRGYTPRWGGDSGHGYLARSEDVPDSVRREPVAPDDESAQNSSDELLDVDGLLYISSSFGEVVDAASGGFL